MASKHLQKSMAASLVVPRDQLDRVFVDGCVVGSVGSGISFTAAPLATAAGSSFMTIPCSQPGTISWLFLPYIATPIFVQLSSQPVLGSSAGSAALAALAALATRLSNAAAPRSLSACAAACAGFFPSTAASLRQLLLFFFTRGGSNGGCLVLDKEEGGGVESNCVLLSFVVGNREGGGGGVFVLCAKSGCLFAEEEGSKSVCVVPAVRLWM
jgi:hypothetical protein